MRIKSDIVPFLRTTLCVVAVLLASAKGLAQDLDSLKRVSFQQTGTQRVDTYLKIGETHLNKFGAADSLLAYSEKAYQYALQIEYMSGAYRAMSNVALAYARQNDIKNSSAIWQSLLQQQEFRDPEFIGNVHLRLGLNANFENRDDQAMEHFTEASKCFQEINDADGLGLTYCRMAYLFSTQKQFDKVVHYCQLARNITHESSDKFTQASVYSSITGLYIQVGTEQPAYIDSAIYYGTQTLSMAIEHEYYTKGSQLCNSLSAACNMKGENTKALEYLKLATNFNPYLSKGEAIITYLNLCDAYAGLQRYDLCLTYLDSSSAIAYDLQDLYYSMMVAERMYVYNKEAGNLLAAMAGLEQFKVMEDSLFTKEKVTSLNEINAKYESELKDAEIENLSQEKRLDNLKIILLVIGIVFALVSLVLILIIFRQRSFAQQQRIIEAELRLSRSRINPHFFFNAMAALQSQALNEKDNTKIALYLSKYAKIMRLTLEGSYNNLVTIESELDFLIQYMDLQKLRTKNKFDYTIDMPEEANLSLLKVPSMILQPFVENSIEHGFANIDYPGKILITIRERNQRLEIVIDDNGLGGSTENQIKEFPSRATSIIQDRLFLLSNQVKTQAGFEMSKKKNENGFQVKLFLPIIES